jgi:hypothetical protein
MAAFTFRLTVSTDLATLCTASPFCVWRRFSRLGALTWRAEMRDEMRAGLQSAMRCRFDRSACIALSSRLCDVPRRRPRIPRVSIGLHTRRPRTAEPRSLAVFSLRGYPVARPNEVSRWEDAIQEVPHGDTRHMERALAAHRNRNSL